TANGTTTYTYTDNGEVASKITGDSDVTNYTYDGFGNLRTVVRHAGTYNESTIEYVIDSRNRRIGKKIDGALVQGWLYEDQLNPVAELDGTGHFVAQFVYGSRATVPDYMIKNSSVYRIISDHLGNSRIVLNISDGTVL